MQGNMRSFDTAGGGENQHSDTPVGGEWDLKTEGELPCSKHWPPRVGEQCASRWKDSRTTLYHGWRMSPEPPPLSFMTYT